MHWAWTEMFSDSSSHPKRLLTQWTGSLLATERSSSGASDTAEHCLLTNIISFMIAGMLQTRSSYQSGLNTERYELRRWGYDLPTDRDRNFWWLHFLQEDRKSTRLNSSHVAIS